MILVAFFLGLYLYVAFNLNFHLIRKNDIFEILVVKQYFEAKFKMFLAVVFCHINWQ